MKDNFSISTVAYSGYPIEEALDAIYSLGVYNIELALIQGAVYDLDEDGVNEQVVTNIRAQLNQRKMHCTSLAAHCEITLENCNELLLKRVKLTRLLDCPRLIVYAPRDGSLAEFQQAAREAIVLAEAENIKILIENVGDQQPYMLNDCKDFASVLQAYTSESMGINFDPGNLASHRPQNDLLMDTVQSLSVAEHIHIKDLFIEGDSYRFCTIGNGICHYPELFRRVAQGQKMPFFSIEAPFALIRKTDGRAILRPKDEVLPIEDINHKLHNSIQMILACAQC
ncbi:TIM barrel protein [Vibrio sp. TH_r3]|uniref:sugar phosphate isomerase/epimerase family protein n=1 Tax=Vibrio sp. TH_r3 TaxID=3082084 RepID=UPI002954B88E|nr:TIM barrel protein [Vibrio sp. TH_r3]MDV7105508.1 TIM barrel protein [Vibrio sp. TH_r3]